MSDQKMKHDYLGGVHGKPHALAGMDLSTFGDGISWEQFADNAMQEPTFFFTYEQKREIMDHIRHYIPNGKVLDCGCNIGRWVRLLKASGFEYVGIDQSDKAIRIAQELSPSTEFHNGFLWDMTFNQEFDLAFCNNVLQHNTLTEKLRILPKIWNALKPNGFLFFNESTVMDSTTTQLTYGGWINLAKGNRFDFLKSWQPNQSGLHECYLFKVHEKLLGQT